LIPRLLKTYISKLAAVKLAKLPGVTGPEIGAPDKLAILLVRVITLLSTQVSVDDTIRLALPKNNGLNL